MSSVVAVRSVEAQPARLGRRDAASPRSGPGVFAASSLAAQPARLARRVPPTSRAVLGEFAARRLAAQPARVARRRSATYRPVPGVLAVRRTQSASLTRRDSGLSYIAIRRRHSPPASLSAVSALSLLSAADRADYHPHSTRHLRSFQPPHFARHRSLLVRPVSPRGLLERSVPSGRPPSSGLRAHVHRRPLTLGSVE